MTAWAYIDSLSSFWSLANGREGAAAASSLLNSQLLAMLGHSTPPTIRTPHSPHFPSTTSYNRRLETWGASVGQRWVSVGGRRRRRRRRRGSFGVQSRVQWPCVRRRVRGERPLVTLQRRGVYAPPLHSQEFNARAEISFQSDAAGHRPPSALRFVVCQTSTSR